MENLVYLTLLKSLNFVISSWLFERKRDQNGFGGYSKIQIKAEI